MGNKNTSMRVDTVHTTLTHSEANISKMLHTILKCLIQNFLNKIIFLKRYPKSTAAQCYLPQDSSKTKKIPTPSKNDFCEQTLWHMCEKAIWLHRQYCYITSLKFQPAVNSFSLALFRHFRQQNRSS